MLTGFFLLPGGLPTLFFGFNGTGVETDGSNVDDSGSSVRELSVLATSGGSFLGFLMINIFPATVGLPSLLISSFLTPFFTSALVLSGNSDDLGAWRVSGGSFRVIFLSPKAAGPSFSLILGSGLSVRYSTSISSCSAVILRRSLTSRHARRWAPARPTSTTPLS